MNFDKDFEDGYAHTSFGSLYFRRHWNDGPSILLLHGLGADVNTWRRLVEHLPENFDVYMVDILGHGRSDKPHIDYTIRTQVDAIAELAGIIGLRDFFLMGHSYGGWISAYYASENPVKGLILEDSAGLSEYFDYIKENLDVEQYKKSMLGEILKMNGNKEYVMSNIIEVDFGPEKLDRAKLSSISMPTKIFWGSEDKIIPVEYGRLFNRYIVGSTIDIIEGAGHQPHYTNPERTAELIRKFVLEHY